MAEAAETADTFDADFDAARLADADDMQDDDGHDAEHEDGEGEGEGEGDGEAEAAQKRAPLDPAVLERRYRDTQKALKAERHAKRELASRMESLERKLQAGGPSRDRDDAEQGLPDPNEDPIGWMQGAQRLIDQMKAQERETTQRQQSTQEHARQMAALQERVTEYESDFRDDHPDYDDAAKHLKTSIAEELTDLGLTGADLTREFEARVVGIVTRAIAAGKDPAEVTYSLARKRGFGIDKGAASLQKIAAGQKASRSLGASGGRAGSAAPDFQAIANLDGAAFDAAFEKLRASERRR